MLSVEECLKALSDICFDRDSDEDSPWEITNNWDRRFINDVASHNANGNPISTAQGEIVLKLIARYEDHLVANGMDQQALKILLKSPYYKVAPYQSTVLPREVRWAGDNTLVFRFKFNASIQEDIKKLKGTAHFLPSSQPMPIFNHQHKVWLVNINAGNYERAMDVIKRHRFGTDDSVVNYFLNAANSLGQKSNVEMEDNILNITVRDDDFFNAWLNNIVDLES